MIGREPDRGLGFDAVRIDAECRALERGDLTERRLAGVEVYLTGTTIFGTPGQTNYTLTAITDANGFYQFALVCDAPANQSFGIGTSTISVLVVSTVC